MGFDGAAGGLEKNLRDPGLGIETLIDGADHGVGVQLRNIALKEGEFIGADQETNGFFLCVGARVFWHFLKIRLYGDRWR